MKKFKSENIESIDYNPETMILYVIFKNSGLYQYHGVSQENWDMFETAGSADLHLHLNIKPFHRVQKITPTRSATYSIGLR